MNKKFEMNISRRLPLSLIQKQFWMLNQTFPDSAAYNIPSFFKIRGALNKDALEKSINSVISRHDIFRTYFRFDNDDVYQYIYPSLYLNIQVESCIEATENLNDSAIDCLVKNEVAAPFDLSNLPLIRVKIFRISNNESLLLITMHHIITDLRTKDLFGEELSLFYNACTSNAEVTCTGPIQQYAEYSIWQNEWAKGIDCQDMLLFWKKKLEGQKGIL